MLRRPDAELRIVVELGRVDGEVVRAPACGRVARVRDRDALVERRDVAADEGELGRDPAVRELIVEHDRVSVAQRGAMRRAREEPGVDRRGRDHLRPRLCPDREVLVDDLHVVVRAHVAVRVRRVAAAHVVDAVEVLIRCGGLCLPLPELQRPVEMREPIERNPQERHCLVLRALRPERAQVRLGALEIPEGRYAVRNRDAGRLGRRLGN